MLFPAVGSAEGQKIGGGSGGGDAAVIVGDHGRDRGALSDPAGGGGAQTAALSALDLGEVDIEFDGGYPCGEFAGRLRHRAAVLDAEVRLLVHVLAPFGVLSRDELARRADCRLWHEGTFEAALQVGVERGVIELLPDGFVACAAGFAESRRTSPSGPIGPR